jgi:carboxypeptidase family protein
MTALPFAMALLLTLGQAATPRQVGAGYRISGMVVDAVTNVPVPHAQVSIFLRNEETSVAASDDGRFAFEGLEAGKYTLYAAAPGYVREGYNQHGAFLVAVATGEGLDSEHLVFRLHPQAVIYGRVTDERGESVRGAQIHLFALERSRGEYLVRGQTQTNDLGEYRFAHLLAGKYYLAVEARPWYAQTQVSAPRPNDGSGQPDTFVRRLYVDLDPALDVVYLITFYPGVTDERSATQLTLSAGEKEQANVILQAVPATRLRLTSLPTEEGSQLNVGARQKVFDTLSLGLNAVFGQVSPGEYEVAGLPPGEVTLVVSANRGNEWTSRTMEADTSSQAMLDASSIQTAARVSGRILLPGGGSDESAGNVSLVSAATTAMPAVTTPLQKDGTFYFPEIQPGTYRVQVNLHSNDYYVLKLSAKEAKTSGREITITGNDVDLTVTLGQGLGQVTGVVHLDGKPAAGVMVLLVPESGLEIKEDSRIDESDSDGTFNLGGILPGEYVLLAIKNGWDLEWAKPDVLKPYLPGGQKLSIASNRSLKVTALAQEETTAAGMTSQ